MKSSIVIAAVLGLFGCQELDARLAARDGFVAYAEGDYLDAVGHYQEAYDARPDNQAVVTNLAYAHLAAAKAAKVFDNREAHLRQALELLLAQAQRSHEPALALQAAASSLDWLRLASHSSSDDMRVIATQAYAAALAADAAGEAGSMRFASLLLRERSRVQNNINEARADVERADEIDELAHVHDGVAAIELVTISTP